MQRRGRATVDIFSSVNTNLCAAVKMIVKLTTVNFPELCVYVSYVSTRVCLKISYTCLNTWTRRDVDVYNTESI